MASAKGGTRNKAGDLQTELHEFASARRDGWSHDDWLGLLDRLRERGHDTDDPERIGSLLERERLAVMLAGVQGMGPRRVEALLQRFGSVWALRNAGVDEIAATPQIPRSLAERVAREVH